jgi:hypothetical protein
MILKYGLRVMEVKSSLEPYLAHNQQQSAHTQSIISTYTISEQQFVSIRLILRIKYTNNILRQKS